MTTSPLPIPNPPPSVSLDIVTVGPPVPPLDRIRLFDDSEWEDFVLEWGHSLRTKYARVERSGGAGDMGRDVIGLVDENDDDVWDNYQCKHYASALTPTHIWLELGKLMHYTSIREFTYPRKYSFVAPRGAGTKLANFLRNGDQMRHELFQKWDQYCKEQITDTGPIHLDAAMRNYIESCDFSIFDYVPPLRLIEQHRSTPWHLHRFGGGLPERPTPDAPPPEPAPIEVVYLGKLMDAYAEHLGCSTCDAESIAENAELLEHYRDTRIEFYSAESLRTFSRDTLPGGSYEDLQGEVHHGIRDELRREHANGFQRLLSVIATARALQITSHALVVRMTVRDRGGICHQLANDSDQISWVRGNTS